MMKLLLLIALALVLMGQSCETPSPVSTYCYGNDYSIYNNVEFGYSQHGVSGGISAILRGDPSDNMRSTVQVTFGQAYCTGVVLSPTVVLTAGHCGYASTTAHTVKVFERDESSTPGAESVAPALELASSATGLVGEDGSEMFAFNMAGVDASSGVMSLVASVAATSHLVHPDYLEYTESGGFENRKADLMILYLSEPLTVPQVKGFYDERFAKFCQGGVAQGFGRWEGDYLDIRETKYIITNATEKLLISRASMLPDGEESGRICFGDSGGPLYMDVGGVSYLAGITTTTMSADCERGGSHVRVRAFDGWIITNSAVTSL